MGSLGKGLRPGFSPSRHNTLQRGALPLQTPVRISIFDLFAVADFVALL